MSSIHAAKAGMGFMTASERVRCGNCAHHQTEYVDRMPPYDRAGIKCKLGGFMVSANAVCLRHQAKPHVGAPVPA